MAIGQTLQKVIKILDGQPTGRKGQSLVEMALTTPILILMILGMVEVGFLANNYLILMDAVRAGSRDAVNLDPTAWPYGGARDMNRLDCDTKYSTAALDLGTENSSVYGVRWVDPLSAPPVGLTLTQPRGYYTLGAGAPSMVPPGVDLGYTRPPASVTTTDPNFGFFDEVACQTLNAMLPLQYNDSDGPINASNPFPSQDDVVVSAVSYSTMDYNPTTPPLLLPANRSALYGSGPGNRGDHWVTVTGRWPLENRFCAVSDQTTAVGGYHPWLSGDSRDPFNYLTTQFNNSAAPAAWSDHSNSDGTSPDNAVNPPYTGIYGKVTEGIHYKTNGAPDSNNLYILDVSKAREITDGTGKGDNQGVRGYVFSGHHKNSGAPNTPAADNCFGSEFRVQDIEAKLNLNDAVVNPKVPNGGLVIVEIYWQHHPLFFGPLFQGFTGNKGNDPILHVWGFFPVPAAEATPTP